MVKQLSTQKRCRHCPQCPPADRDDRDAAAVIASHPEQGWSLLCNGVVIFDDLGHVPQEEMPARTVDEITKFITGT